MVGLKVFLMAVFIAFVAENAELVTLTSSLQNREKELQHQLSKSDEKNHQQLVYISDLQTTLADTDRILKELSDDILKKEHEFKNCKGKRYGTRNKYNNCGLSCYEHIRYVA